ncbi:MAG: NIPSNAP family protein [Gammaproteobacteria bacterium]|nr:NIPSNAP family protein [Gammaproteobacteria bacterium]MCY4358988.1 NIPSNAP family protein [Gammaproteobacteria bacterium]
MRKYISFLVCSLFLANGAIAQDNMAPCGPADTLSESLSANVDAESRCFELRMYTAEPAVDNVGGIDNLHQRFREEEVAIFEKHGAEVIAVWQRLDNPNTLVWMLAYRNRAHRQQVWEAFAADPAWEALRSKYPVPLSAEVYMMSATDYSSLK